MFWVKIFAATPSSARPGQGHDLWGLGGSMRRFVPDVLSSGLTQRGRVCARDGSSEHRAREVYRWAGGGV
jgi:hypothetical protein